MSTVVNFKTAVVRKLSSANLTLGIVSLGTVEELLVSIVTRVGFKPLTTVITKVCELAAMLEEVFSEQVFTLHSETTNSAMIIFGVVV